MPAQRWLHILPVATFMYAVAFVNRTNISLALPAMSRELHMDSAQAGSVAGIFFWGYLLLQIPGGYLATHWSTKRFVSLLLIAWGLCSVGCGFVHTWHQLWIMRFLLGVSEGGMYPATLLLIARWFPRRERASANAWFSLALPLSQIVVSPLSGWLLDRWNWRVMLISEGMLPLLCLLPWILMVRDTPREASWISKEELNFLENEYQRDVSSREPQRSEVFARALLSPKVLLLALLKLLMITGQLGYLFWLPSAMEQVRHLSNLRVGVLYAIPFVVGALSMLFTSWHSDKKNERRGHVSAPMALGGFALLGCILTSHQWPILAYGLACLSAVAAFAPLGPFWAMPTEWFSRKMAGSVAGFVNGVGQLGGYFGPFLVGYLNKRTGSFVYGFGLLGAFMLIGAVLPYFLVAPLSERAIESQPSSL